MMRAVEDDDLSTWPTLDELVALHPIYPSIINPSGGFITPAPIDNADDPEKRKAAREESSVITKAAAFAKSLCTTLTPAEQLSAAALPQHIKRKNTRKGFCYRFPQWVPERHDDFADAIEDGSFAAKAKSLGYSIHHAQIVRCEVIFIMLARGEVPAFSIIDARQRYPKKDEGPTLAGAFPVLWAAHEEALLEVERRGLRREGESTILRPHREMLAVQLFQAMTEVKVAKTHDAARKLLKQCDALIDEFQRERNA